MRLKSMLPIFSCVFMAELGDKTQIATVLFVAGATITALEVFIASSLALVFSSLLAVIFGGAISKVISPKLLQTLAGLIFFVMGGIYIFQGLNL